MQNLAKFNQQLQYYIGNTYTNQPVARFWTDKAYWSGTAKISRSGSDDRGAPRLSIEPMLVFLAVPEVYENYDSYYRVPHGF